MLPPKVTDTPYAEEQLLLMVERNPGDWNARKTFARFLYDRGDTKQAAEMIWSAPEIPSVDFEIAFAARILAKGIPRRAIRLLNAVLENNRNKPAQNLGLANALLHHGMVMQAARFYGAAIEADDKGDMLNPDLEHFLLWVDDREKLWGDFEGQKDELDELPWMNRSAKEADELRRAMDGHTTPVTVKSAPPIEAMELPATHAEELKHPRYVQTPGIGDEPTPPPAVSIPMDRVAPKDRVMDQKLGAESTIRNGAPSQESPVNDSLPHWPSKFSPMPHQRPTPAPAPTTPKPGRPRH